MLVIFVVTSPVAFSASPTITMRYDNGSIVYFNNIITNIGEFYDPVTSMFQCPYDGVYLFSISLQSDADKFMHGEIFREGVPLLSAWADNVDDIQSSVVVVVECLESELVWVECLDDDMELIGGKRSSFSGVLITPYA